MLSGRPILRVIALNLEHFKLNDFGLVLLGLLANLDGH